MLVWLVLKIHDFKYPATDDRRISYISKKSYFWWGSEQSLYYIIPTVSIYIGKISSIEICWLQLYYSVTYKAVTYEEEEAIANALRELRKQKLNNNESSCL